MYKITSVIISYDSQLAITNTKKNDREYYIKMYSLSTNEQIFEEKVGGGPKDYIKVKEVEQSADGKQYAIVYNNDGKFRLRNFGREQRNDEQQIFNDELDINQLLGIDDWTMAIQGFPDPYITCTFIDDTRVFVNLFHNHKLIHYHFIYDFVKK